MSAAKVMNENNITVEGLRDACIALGFKVTPDAVTTPAPTTDAATTSAPTADAATTSATTADAD